MKPISAPVAAEVRQEVASEAALIRKAKQVLSSSSWQLGEIAAQWTAAYSRGRTDEDFGTAVGSMTGDQVFQRRRVWERWGISDIYRKFGSVLSWSHFYAAMNWDDADACLELAYENQATVAEMKAWRTAQSAQADPFGDEDPFGEREGTVTEDGGEDSEPGEEEATEEDGTDSEESGTRPPRNGKDKPGEKPPKTQQELFAEQKSKTVKTAEALMRAIDDLNELVPIPQHDSLHKGVGKMILTVKAHSKNSALT